MTRIELWQKPITTPRILCISTPNPRILFIGANDWANLANRVGRGMNRFTRSNFARVWTLEAHPFGYDEGLVGPIGSFASKAALDFVQNGVDWIITTGDGDYNAFTRMLDYLGVEPGQVRFAATHAGTAYRQGARDYNLMDQEMGFACRFIGADSLAYAVKGPPAYLYWPTYDPIEPPSYIDPPDGSLRVVHSPSSRLKKGTASIQLALENVIRDSQDETPEPFPIDAEILEGSFGSVLERRAKGHVFVDQMAPFVGGFGASAIEAMAQGLAVLGDVRNIVSQETFHAHGFDDDVPIIDCRDQEELECELLHLWMEPETLAITREQSLAWATRYASPEAVGRYFLEVLERHA